jgi:hypothetical protein
MTPNLRAKFSLYETDYLAWIEATVQQLERKDLAQVDWENLIEELKDMGRSERRSLESNLVVLLTHLLKWQYQPTMRSGSWKGSITEHRRRLRKALHESPSLRPYFKEILAECYSDAVRIASDETGLSVVSFPQISPHSEAQILDFDFLPT